MKKNINDGLKKYIENRMLDNEKKILDAMKLLSEQSKKITMKAISDIIGMSRVNLYIYKDLIDKNKELLLSKNSNKPLNKKRKVIKFKNDGLKEYEEKRRAIKEKKILKAIRKLKENSEKITMQKIADLIGTSRPSLYTYKSFIESNKN